MVRLNVIAEGATEEAFVNRLLKDHLATRGVYVAVRQVGAGSRGRGRGGGDIRYARVKPDLERWLREDRGEDAWYTTMFDLHALGGDFPGHEAARHQNDPYQRVHLLESALRKEIPHPRFIPYLQVHEFEALVFVDPQPLRELYLEGDEITAVTELIALAGQFDNPELIDHDQPPSHRLRVALPGYHKVVAGVLVAESLGLSALRDKCPHFACWLTRLETLNG